MIRALFLMTLALPLPAKADPDWTQAFRAKVQACWLADPALAHVKVVAGFDLDTTGRVEGDVSLVRADGGTLADQARAFAAARRAVVRCQPYLAVLPDDQYALWHKVELTFVFPVTPSS